MSEKEASHLIAYWVSCGLSITGRLWPWAWLNQHLCGVSGQHSASWRKGSRQGRHFWHFPHGYCSFSLLIDVSLAHSYSASYGSGSEENPKFRVTCTYVYCTHQFKDMLYAANQWACKWCTLYARLMDKSPFLKWFMNFPFSVFFLPFSKFRG